VATETSLKRYIGIDLRVVASALVELPLRAEEPEEDDWSDLWPDVMARFGWLVDLANQGQIEAEEAAKCRELLLTLRRLLPLTEQLDLPVPDSILAEIGKLPAEAVREVT